LVNTMFSDGQYHIDLFGLMALFKGLQPICAQHGAELAVRLKPSTPALNVVSGALGAPAEYFARTTQAPIDQVASDTDLCLAWGELTTGSINFLDAGSLVLHVSEEDWPTQLAPQAPFLHERLVSSMHVDQAMALVATLLADSAEFQRLQRLQSSRYALRRVDAHDTFFPHPSEARSMTSC